MEFKAVVTQKGKIFEGKAPEIINNALTAAMYEGIALIERNVKRFTPVGVYGAQGGLLASEHGEVIGKGTPVVKGVFGSSSPYAEVVEKGRTAGKAWPPEGSLIRWINLKLGVEGKAAKGLEFIIRRKIGRKGFPGAHMFEKGLEVSMPGLQEIFDRSGFVIATELSE